MNKNYDLLMECGFQARHVGTQYVLDAMEIFAPGMSMTKELYPAVARKRGVTHQAVERCIRHAIAAAACHGEGQTHDEIVGKFIDRSNNEVLARLYFRNLWGESYED